MYANTYANNYANIYANKDYAAAPRSCCTVCLAVLPPLKAVFELADFAVQQINARFVILFFIMFCFGCFLFLGEKKV